MAVVRWTEGGRRWPKLMNNPSCRRCLCFLPFLLLLLFFERVALIPNCILVYNVLSNLDQDVFIYSGEKYNCDKKKPLTESGQ